MFKVGFISTWLDHSVPDVPLIKEFDFSIDDIRKMTLADFESNIIIPGFKEYYDNASKNQENKTRSLSRDNDFNDSKDVESYVKKSSCIYTRDTKIDVGFESIKVDLVIEIYDYYRE